MINIYGIASGMKYLHSLNIVHRDLKTENILEDEFLFPKISDFGLSKKMLNDNKNQTNFIGTPAYMAPEVVNSNDYNEKSDVYSFSILLYQLFSPHNLYQGLNNFQIMRLIDNGGRPKIDFDIPSFYENLIKMCWDEKPEKRPSFSEIVKMLLKKNFIKLLFE